MENNFETINALSPVEPLSRNAQRAYEHIGSLKWKRRNRRRKSADRRKSVREGIFVSFSFANDRRKTRDRRKTIS
ncbi:hypothetical protein MTBBW1_1620008 [Desulfamplus magnetovallimortis]|uniref:Uncharacterized protein n=1 Tax=Desulfamplus magnetovallimortis TaxID=1246637 RepID=A0A1W1H952_9BACT|nr:hypothetical protein [Desulfamplus magnetovallimortis]SLM28888.1 hypothetical protein MTBBW1_1620008 [Desulfamplus magnetovallimortis]